MKIEISDFNNADQILNKSQEWRELDSVISEMPLHLKASDQAGIQGSLIFDPVGTNAYVQNRLYPIGWKATRIAAEHAFLGLGVDFVKAGVLLEVQFSNYPFLVNNLLRSELFYRDKVTFNGKIPQVAIILVKARMFPASNSTLYYEQALKLLDKLSHYEVFKIPVRLVGLFEVADQTVSAILTESAARYSRDVSRQTTIQCRISSGRSGDSRCRLERC